MNQNQFKDHTGIWIRTEALDLLREASTPPRNARKRLIPTHVKQRQQNPQDWGWVFGYIVSNSQIPTSARNARIKSKSEKSSCKTIQISDASSTYDKQTYTISSPDAFAMANAHDSNESSDLPPNDLINLTHLHEPAVISSLKKRYSRDEIYTSTGPILLALNPFKRCPDLYSQKMVDLYSNFNPNSQNHDRNKVETTENISLPPPHVFQVADRAFKSMANHESGGNHPRNQSILVSGESGAGKTVTTKFVMQYLANLSQKSQKTVSKSDTTIHKFRKINSQDTKEGGIEQQVLQSNPILESFGNARTIRNDNSSRFGKFIEIQFQCHPIQNINDSPTLVGATIKTYLLEKVRLITQAKGERNFHIFYEVISGASTKEREALYLYDLMAEDFNLINSSGTYDRRDGVKDSSTYKDLKKAMNTMEFSSEEQHNAMSVVCALLHASNITFEEYESDASQIEESNPFVGAAVTLLGVSAQDLNTALCTCAIEVRGERLMKNLSLHQASKALEAFIKATYSALFRYIVQAVNASIAGKRSEENGKKRPMDTSSSAFVGVLDIFGFESFIVNSFEQLCINYCNEALQQQFNKFIFKLEQQEYEREGIQWSFIEFPDNQDVLDLIDKKHSGILSILDEQCRLAKCTDKSFANAINEKCSFHDRYQSTPTQRVSGLFSVNHYAGPVEYTSSSFLEKNKDELPQEATELLQSSSNPFLPMLARLLTNPSEARSSPKKDLNVNSNSSVVSVKSANRGRSMQRKSSSLSRASVGSQFARQLQDLRERIDYTSPHYIRCLKPNDELVPDYFDGVIIADQLRCAGVLEAVRVSRVGYPQRYPYNLFIQRYRILGLKELQRIPSYQKSSSCEILVHAVANQIINDSENSNDKSEIVENKTRNKSAMSLDLIKLGIQIGKTKVFLRQQAFDSLEKLRNIKVDLSATKVQAALRMYLAKSAMRMKLIALIRIQCYIRRYNATVLVRRIRVKQATLHIQTFWRKYQIEKLYKCKRFIATWSQRWYRGGVGRRIFKTLKINKEATKIQTNWRRYHAASEFGKICCSCLTIQCLFRCRVAYKTLKGLKKDAKSLNIVVDERDKLKKEALQMRKELEVMRLKAQEDLRDRTQQKKIDIQDLKRQTNYTTSSEISKTNTGNICDNDEFVALKNENGRLQKELEQALGSIRARKAIPSNESEHADEIIRLTKLCNEKDSEIDELRKELDFLRENNLLNKEERKKVGSDVLHDAIMAEDIDESQAVSSQIMKKVLRFRPSGSEMGASIQENINVHSSENDGGYKSSIVSNIFTPQKMFSKLGSFNSFLGKNSNERSGSPLSALKHNHCLNSDAQALLSNSDFSFLPKDEFSRNTQEDNHSIIGHTSDVFERSSVCPSVLSSSFIDHEGNGTPLHHSILSLDYKGLIQAIKSSHDIHKDINTGDGEGRTPLHLAALNSATNMVSILLKNFAVTNSQDHSGNSPLHYAEEVNTIRALLQGGARPNIPNEDGICALHIAVQRKDVKAVEVLIEYGADVNVADNIRWYTPLHIIAQSEIENEDLEYSRNDKSIVLKISAALTSSTESSPPDLNSQDKDGNTPLHHCCILENDDAETLIKLFLEKGSNPNLRNDRGQTPLHLFCHNMPLRRFPFYDNTLKFLLVSGGDTNIASISGCTPLHLALYHRDTDTAIQLVEHGAQLHLPWKKPSHWASFWEERGQIETLGLDMITDNQSLAVILSSIRYKQVWAPSRPNCMQCNALFGPFVRQHHCRHCGRLVCGQCSPRCLDSSFFPSTFESTDPIEIGPCRVCTVCENILKARLNKALSFSLEVQENPSAPLTNSHSVAVDL